MRNFNNRTMELQNKVEAYIAAQDKPVRIQELQLVFMHGNGYKASSIANACADLAIQGRLVRVTRGTYAPNSPQINWVDNPFPEVTIKEVHVPTLLGRFMNMTICNSTSVAVSTTYGVYQIHTDDTANPKLLCKFREEV